jgi:hypothetical protein
MGYDKRYRRKSTMKYLLMFVSTTETDQFSEAENIEIDVWWREHTEAGRILGGEQLQGVETATTVRHDHGNVTIVDGPFVESKEHIAGYGLIDVKDLDAALDLAKSWPWGGVVEIRPILAM